MSSSSKKVLGKKDIEKQKKIADEEAAAKAYQEFVATFEETPKQTKLFVRGNVINSASGGMKHLFADQLTFFCLFRGDFGIKFGKVL